ncbi:hypothetical protein BS47DRAFT_1485220 [Hydnum rufescens UP504]|uniref:Uncharacterized protein n=1 Tax=Hydnum rufescens UP504 TaxID=1448309 RepID=A0A9P6DX48_9AGAM|nr:hypothetical protein BS47DRAFT_1485220 [Hydnum rufescens UP504]
MEAEAEAEAEVDIIDDVRSNQQGLLRTGKKMPASSSFIACQRNVHPCEFFGGFDAWYMLATHILKPREALFAPTIAKLYDESHEDYSAHHPNFEDIEKPNNARFPATNTRWLIPEEKFCANVDRPDNRRSGEIAEGRSDAGLQDQLAKTIYRIACLSPNKNNVALLSIKILSPAKAVEGLNVVFH